MVELKSIGHRTPARSIPCRFVFALTAALLSGSAHAGTLWYNGDADGVNSYTNQNNALAQEVLYNAFNVPAPGWNVNSVWSNDVFTEGPPASTTATWAIYKDMGGASSGTIVATGDSLATLVPTGTIINIPGLGFNNLTEYSVTVSGLDVHLVPGEYWLGVYPDNTNGGYVGNDETTGLNGIGTPTGGNHSLYATLTPGPPQSGDPYFAATNPLNNPQPYGTSAGIAGITAVPEPGTVTLLGLGALGLILLHRRRRRTLPWSGA